ncbi:MAG: thioredoxin domain-containing protein, partial [Candidatus Promineifilaceae bacterium]
MLKRAVMLLVVALVFAGCASPTNENPSPTVENVSPTVENTKPVEETTTPLDETASLTDENVTSAAEVDPTDTAIPATEDTSTSEEETEPEPSETAVDTDGSMTSFPDRDDTIGLVEYCWKNPGSCIGHGDPMAPVIMVEISDYGCGHCMNFNLNTAPVLEELYVEDGKVFWLVLPFALSEDRVPSAASAMCAAEQDAFTQSHR